MNKLFALLMVLAAAALTAIELTMVGWLVEWLTK